MKNREIRARGRKVNTLDNMMARYMNHMFDPESPLNILLENHSPEEIMKMLEGDTNAREKVR